MSVKQKQKISRLKVHKGEVKIPQNIAVKVEDKNILVVSGPLGSVKKDFSKIPVELNIVGDKIEYKILWKGKKGYSLINTIASLIKNLFIGVTKGYTYKMKIYFTHFPITVEVKEKEVVIKNFKGERGIRRAKIVGDTRVKVVGDTVLVSGLSKEEVGLTAANITAACKIKDKDPRVFLDGIYLYSKEEGMEVA